MHLPEQKSNFERFFSFSFKVCVWERARQRDREPESESTQWVSERASMPQSTSFLPCLSQNLFATVWARLADQFYCGHLHCCIHLLSGFWSAQSKLSGLHNKWFYSPSHFSSPLRGAFGFYFLAESHIAQTGLIIVVEGDLELLILWPAPSTH